MMFTLLFILLNSDAAIGGAAAGGSGVIGLCTWLVRRYIKKRDAQEDEMHKKLNLIMENTHRTSTDVEVIKSRLGSGDQRMERIEANVDDLRQDMRVLKRRATDKTP